MSELDRRKARRGPSYLTRRRYPRVFLDVDWFVEAQGSSTLGRGVEISPRSAAVRIPRTTDFTGEVTLYLSLPARPRMFRARGIATPKAGPHGWVIRFFEVSDDDLKLLGQTLLEEVGLSAFPNLERDFSRFADLHRRFLRTSL